MVLCFDNWLHNARLDLAARPPIYVLYAALNCQPVEVFRAGMVGDLVRSAATSESCLKSVSRAGSADASRRAPV